MTIPQVMTRPGGMTNTRRIGSPKAMVAERLYRRWLQEFWAGRRIAADLVAPDFVGHWPTRDVRGPDELQAVVDQTRTEFQELAFVVDVGPFVSADGDGVMVAARWIGTGSGSAGPARFTGNDLMRIRDNTIVEYWSGTARA